MLTQADDDLALLVLQLEWGADEAIDLDPIDRLQPIQSRSAPKPPAAPLIDAPKGTPQQQATALAAQATTIAELRDAIASFTGCSLRDTASHLVFAEGDPHSQTLIIGDPPGRDEDRAGRPFAGADGELLDQMLLSIGLSRTTLMLSPLLPWRPPGGRPPSPAELAICLPFLHRLITLIKPRRMLLLGPTAARAVTQSRRRGALGWVQTTIPGMPDPIQTLSLPGLTEMQTKPLLKRDAWAGLRLLKRTLDGG